jgi:4a-hydroxytetrahydrobiopterin dehydratase
MAPKLLNAEEREKLLTCLLASSKPWKLRDAQGRDALVKTFEFDCHAAAMAFLLRVGMHAEVRNHHPEYSGCYSRVTLVWTTHDCGGISALDAEMANFCDAVGPVM